MVQIKIKGIKNKYHVIASYDDENAFFNTLQERLKNCLQANCGHFEAFFHVPIDIDIFRLFAVCKQCKTLILGIHEMESKKESNRVIEGDLRSGEEYCFYENIILIGSIHKLAYVTSSESLYVIGKVYGSVDLLHEDCVLCASSINGNIRICDTLYQNVTSFAPTKVYYQNRNIMINKYKEDLQWEKL